jgi:hypothetical protein
LLLLAPIAVAQQPTPIVPNPKVTPGDAFGVTVQDLYVSGYAKKVRKVLAEMKREVFEEYSVTSHDPGDYEGRSPDSARTRRFQLNQKSLAGVSPNVALERPSKTPARRETSRAGLQQADDLEESPAAYRRKLERINYMSTQIPPSCGSRRPPLR